MKWELVHVTHSTEPWYQEAIQLYEEKISHFISFKAVGLKIKKASRDERTLKQRQESESLLSYLETSDLVVLLDEKGKKYDSVQFSNQIENILNSSKKRVVFLVGGAYGVNEEVKSRSNVTLSLSDFTMNHLLAQVVLMEQIYRAFTILRKLPYHNQ